MPDQTPSLRKRLKYLAQMGICRGLYALFPGSEWVQFHLGNAYAEHGRPERAIPLWQAACARRPARPAALHNLATTLMQLERPGEAIEPLQQLIAGAPRPDTYALLGLACQRAQRLPEAITAYERALAGQPDNQALRLNLGVLLERTRQPDRALEHYRLISAPDLRERAATRIAALEKPHLKKGEFEGPPLKK